jgi:hypothetical protein
VESLEADSHSSTDPPRRRATELLQASRYAFVITILWIGFVLAISFMEAPLKFRAPSLTLPVALEIGHLVFHALNRVETVFAAVLLISMRFGEPTDRMKGLYAAAVLIFAAQTLLLFTRLDERTMTVIQGGDVPSSPFHWVYIGLEVVKLLFLGSLAWNQIRALEAPRGGVVPSDTASAQS